MIAIAGEDGVSDASSAAVAGGGVTASAAVARGGVTASRGLGSDASSAAVARGGVTASAAVARAGPVAAVEALDRWYMRWQTLCPEGPCHFEETSHTAQALQNRVVPTLVLRMVIASEVQGQGMHNTEQQLQTGETDGCGHGRS